MRNLKKMLSLVMALAMIASFMVVGASAAQFTDEKDIKHSEAVNTLVTLGVINGRDTGAYDPTGSLTRAEMAKLITVVLNGGKNPVLGTKAVPTYSDIKGNWAENYIEYCSSLNVISGMGDGTFAPSGTLTGSQAAKMLLVAMNYDAKVFGFTGANWEINVNVEANKAGLYKDLSSMNPSATITRDEAAQLVYNAIQSNTMKLSWGQNMATGEVSQNYTLTGNSLFVDKFNGAAYEGVLVASGKDSILGASASQEYFSVKAKKLNNSDLTASTSPVLNSNVQFKYKDQDLTALMGQYVKVLYNTTDKTVYGVYAVTGKNTVVTSTTDKVSDKTSDSIKIDGVKYDTDGLAYTASDSYADKVTFVDNNGDGKLDLAIVRPVSTYTVTYVGSTSFTLADQVGNYAAGSLSNKLSDVITYEGMKKDDIAIGTKDPYTGKMMLEKAEVTTGTISGYKSNNSTYQIDGNWFSKLSGTTLALGNKIDYVALGGVIYYSKVTSGATDVTNMVMVITTDAGSTVNGAQAKLIFSDGTKKVVTIANDSPASPSSGVTYTYEINNSGEYKLTALTGNIGDYKYLTSPAFNGSGNIASVNNYAISDDAVIFTFKGTVGSANVNNDGRIMTGKELKTVATTSVNGINSAFTKASNGLTKTAVATISVANWLTTTSYANYGYIVSIPYQTTVDGTKYMVYTVWNGSNTVEYKFKTDSTAPAAVKGEVIGYDIIDDTTIKNVTRVATQSTAVVGLNGNEISFNDSMANLTSGTVGKLDGNTTYLYINSAADSDAEIGQTGGSVQRAIQPQSGIYVKNVLVTANNDKTIQLIVVDVNNQIALQSSEKGSLTISGGIPAGYVVTVDGVEYTGNAANVVKPGDVVKITRDASATAVSALTVSDTAMGNQSGVPAAGGYVSYIADGSNLSVVFGALASTSNIALQWQASGAAGGTQTAQAPGAVAVGPINNATTSVVITLTNTATQTITKSGANQSDVTLASGAGATVTVDTSSIAAAGGTKTFTLTVSETGMTAITYNVTVTVAP